MNIAQTRHAAPGLFPGTAAPGMIWVADADDGFRAGVFRYFAERGLVVQGFERAEQMLARARTHCPACAILDVNLSDMQGPEVQQRLAACHPLVPLIFTAARADVPTVVHAMREGASDFLAKPVDPAQLLESVRQALQFRRGLDERALRRETMRCRLRTLTLREQHILKLALAGQSNKEIAQAFGISPRTVETHRANIVPKLGVANLLELAYIFADLGKLERHGEAAPHATETETLP